ncbi:MAG: hypothetical protein HY866_11180 [Chloroflexi bacterium]|nr:hypothetical protein [Chloroflexota bacterium]
MNDMLDNLPSVRNLIKLIIVLILGLIVVSLVVKIVSALMPLFVMALLVVGGVYLYRKLQTNNA